MTPGLVDPYICEQGVLPKHLYGMDDVTALTDRSLVQVKQGEWAKSVIVLGMEGLGKSTILRWLNENASSQVGTEHKNYYNIWQLDSLIEELDVIFSTRVGFPKWIRKLSSWAWQIVETCPFKIVKWLVSFVNSFRDSRATMVKKMVKYGTKLRKLKRGAVIYIDNLQDLSDAELGTWVTALRQVEMARLPIMFVVTGHPVLLKRIREIHYNVGKLAHVHTLGLLGRDDVRKSLEMPAIQHNKVFTMEALERMVDLCKGYPPVVQLFGSLVWRNTDTPEISISDIQQVLPTVIDSIELNYLEAKWHRMSKNDMTVALALVALPVAERTLDNVVERLGGEREEHAETISRLIEKNVLVEQKPGMLEFAVPFFEDYLVKKKTGD